MALAREIMGSSLTQKSAFLGSSNFLVNRKHDHCFNLVPAQRKRFQVKRASKVPILVAAINEDFDFASTLSANSSASCSEPISRESRRQPGENFPMVSRRNTMNRQPPFLIYSLRLKYPPE
ncbi:unnamed protein product [Fraxinus pennsylvanica]|uniref:Uncharacterized protein n=1 Tax=Fraxinus pennsylvanica TaxID=56036 RepID=A0AAD2DU60_9LAMI|nr:unnamed protein product [Fraxinus pennsylvanica]